ncbi:unnamed protein product, partial [Chrysoparadoxa australica]
CTQSGSWPAELHMQPHCTPPEPLYRVGDVVDVAKRTGPGPDKPDGPALITKCCGGERYDIKFSLGTFMEKGIEGKYLSPSTILQGNERIGRGKRQKKQTKAYSGEEDYASPQSPVHSQPEEEEEYVELPKMLDKQFKEVLRLWSK